MAKCRAIGMQRIGIQEYRQFLAAGTAARTPKRQNKEELLQRSCVEWADMHLNKYPYLEFMFHPANGGARTRAEAGVMKATGVRRGVPDLLLPFASGANAGCFGLALELKSSKGALSAHQRRWLERFARDRYISAVVRSLDDFILCVRAWHGETTVEVGANFEINGGAQACADGPD